MKRILAMAWALIFVWAPMLPAEAPSNVPKPIPVTRPEMKAALESLKERQPRIPLPTPADGEASASYLPESWGGGGGFGGQNSDAMLDHQFMDSCFWIVSRGNNCHYCLGHQELKLRFAGLEDDTIAALDSDWSRFDPRQHAAFTFARKLTLEPGLVGDADITTLKADFSDAEIIELAFSIALFNAVNRWTDGMGLAQERHFGDDGESMFTTPTSELFQHTKSIIVPADRQSRPLLETLEQVQQSIAAARSRASRVILPTVEDARHKLASVIGDRKPYEWERALAQLPVNGKAHVRTWNLILSDDHLTPRLKAELAFTTAVNNRAWYAAAHSAHRLKKLGTTAQDLASLLVEGEQLTGGAAAAIRVAAKSTTDPHLITDSDLAQVREHFSDSETAQIMQVICLANMFDRFTEAIGLPVEESIYR